MRKVMRTRVDSTSRLTDAAIDSWTDNGCLVIEDFVSKQTCENLLTVIGRLVDTFDPDDIKTVFSTTSQAHAAADYFETSGDKIRFFFEDGALDSAGQLTCPKERALNKIGHALHDLDPDFEVFSYEPSLAVLAGQLGLDDALLLQSMVIFKQPHIGGEVVWHQDSSFLYTEPLSALGFWFALEDADLENGCLWALPGEHLKGLRQRFHRVDGVLTMTDREDMGAFDLEHRVPLEVPQGTLVVLHGSLPHYSAPNHSDRSRCAFTLHAISARAQYPGDNWLQREPDMPLRFLSTAQPA